MTAGRDRQRGEGVDLHPVANCHMPPETARTMLRSDVHSSIPSRAAATSPRQPHRLRLARHSAIEDQWLFDDGDMATAATAGCRPMGVDHLHRGALAAEKASTAKAKTVSSPPKSRPVRR
jgi:hypothetical protein